ncbi:hypothetical protein Tco_0462220 [Tanacetum coccineum]
MDNKTNQSNAPTPEEPPMPPISSFPTVEESAYIEYLEEEAKAEKERARAEKEWEEFMKEEQAHDELFRLECRVKSDSEYETD